jgi:hypothetical protein
MSEQKQMSQAEREARQMMADKKMQKATDAAYDRSLTSTEQAPKPAPKPAMPAKKMAKGGSVSASRRADGVASKGKTKGTMVKMARGGKAC